MILRISNVGTIFTSLRTSPRISAIAEETLLAACFRKKKDISANKVQFTIRSSMLQLPVLYVTLDQYSSICKNDVKIKDLDPQASYDE